MIEEYDNFPINYPLPVIFFKNSEGVVEVGIRAHKHPPKPLIKKCLMAIVDYENNLTDTQIKDFNEHQIEMMESMQSKVSEYKPQKGYIYLIESAGLIKIGRSLSKDRIRAYRTENPHGIEVLCMVLVDDYKKTEKELLSGVEEFVVKGKEWIKIDSKQKQSLIDKIKTYERD